MAGFHARFFFRRLVYFARDFSIYLFSLLGFISSIFSKGNGEVALIKAEEDDSDDEPEMHLQFKFPTYEESSYRFQEETGSLLSSEVVQSEENLIDKELETSADNLVEIDEIEGIELLRKLDENEETVPEKQEFLEEHNFFQENCSVSIGSDSDTESTSCSAINHLLSLYHDDFLLDKDFGEEPDINGQDAKMESDEEAQGFPECLNDDNLDGSNSDSLSEEGLNEKTEWDENELESLWEHQELIEQLKMELKKVRGAGLPTILEESEPSATILMDDLKPWKIDEFQREDCIGELQKFYKSYRERMRKFDIVSYQKMYAIGCLQMKDPLQTMARHSKSSSPTLKSLLSANLRLFKNRIHGSDPMKKFIKELHDDLEVVYVAQMCLSWEFLHWQYDKALDLWDSDPDGIRHYNEVAGEFQQFQVLMQRFIEDEPFHGPRVHNYVQSRRVLRSLLQVPVIRADSLKKKGRKVIDEYAITSEMLVEILEESIRIFWRFLRADKDCSIASINGSKKTPELTCTEDANLLLEARKALQKKDRKLKDIMRSENCILRKFRQRREDDESDQVLCFFSQVDLKLVSRTLNMAKITKDQLMWCHNKLNRISFQDRKIHVEPGFLLFPC